MGVFWAVVVAVGIVNRILPIPGQGPKGLWLKRNAIMPAALGQRCVQDFGGWGTLPPRIQTLTLVAFVLINAAHVSIFRGDYDPLVWIPVTIWFLDRVTRGARIMVFSPQIWNTGALVTYNEDAHMVRVVVPLRPNMYEIPPGTFYYLMVLNKWNFWESHPFTVASVSGTRQHTVKQPAEETPLLGHTPLSPEEVASDSEKDHREITFLIRPYDSFTSRLKMYAEAEHPKPATIQVAVDGPYGKTLPLERFDKVLFIVGGSGIAVPLSYLQRLLKSTSQPGSVAIHWAVRQNNLAVDVLNYELRDVLRDERLKITIYATGLDDTRTDGATIRHLVEWSFGRLNVEEIVDRFSATENKGSLAVVTSGPGKMADESRCAVAARTLHSRPRIEYFEESFQY
ncbi:ferric reductase like transmembrane component-domain-containing protein [Fusarium acuminatum]|uniref:Ferric reductase like transmembrane component-domain-containing protein n=1 Tax=Fusarium acuminatum TaxID=5515 RepID=A0ABZ2X1Y8_9HYPO